MGEQVQRREEGKAMQEREEQREEKEAQRSPMSLKPKPDAIPSRTSIERGPGSIAFDRIGIAAPVVRFFVSCASET